MLNLSVEALCKIVRWREDDVADIADDIAAAYVRHAVAMDQLLMARTALANAETRQAEQPHPMYAMWESRAQ